MEIDLREVPGYRSAVVEVLFGLVAQRREQTGLQQPLWDRVAHSHRSMSMILATMDQLYQHGWAVFSGN